METKLDLKALQLQRSTVINAESGKIFRTISDIQLHYDLRASCSPEILLQTQFNLGVPSETENYGR
jgi:hypothetical protein